VIEDHDEGLAGMADPQQRQMNKAEINGRHEFLIDHNWSAQLYERDGRLILRWRSDGRQHGHTLHAKSGMDAELEIRKLLEQIAAGLYRRKPRSQRNQARVPDRLSFEDLIGRFVDAKRESHGENTASNYASRLRHVQEFAATSAAKAKARDAASIDVSFVQDLKAFLATRKVSRNGRAGGEKQLMSAKHQKNVLETLRDCLAWAKQPAVHLLPASFCNPITVTMMPVVSGKPLVRPNPIPLDRRIAMVNKMDAWQLKTLCTLVSLPTRFEDVSGALITDFDLDTGEWRIGSRFDNNDFNKNRTEVRFPLPPILIDLLRLNRGDRAEGPMFLRRARPTRLSTWSSREAFGRHVEKRLVDASRCHVATAQDRKKLIRAEIKRCGGVSTDAISREISRLLATVGVTARPYALREATTDDLKRSGAKDLELRYLTQHVVDDILATYASLDPQQPMERYFDYIAPLLDAMRLRAEELGLLPVDSSAADVASVAAHQQNEPEQTGGPSLKPTGEL
jgi:hypothetical protein